MRIVLRYNEVVLRKTPNKMWVTKNVLTPKSWTDY